MTALLLGIAFFVATFNYNLPLLTREYKGISRHRFREWLFWGWIGARIIGGGLILGIYYVLASSNPDRLSWGLPVVIGFLLVFNLFLTRYEIQRDRNRYYRRGLVDYYVDEVPLPGELFRLACARALAWLDRACRNI